MAQTPKKRPSSVFDEGSTKRAGSNAPSLRTTTDAQIRGHTAAEVHPQHDDQKAAGRPGLERHSGLDNIN